MLIHFWGVRGSLPSPLTGDQVQAKISAAIARMSPKDARDEDSKMRFLSSLPDWIYGTAGGNTPCVELKASDGNSFLLDCGSGIRMMAKYGVQPKDSVYNIFLSHFHWDHIQGFPFFDPIFRPASKINVYSVYPDMEFYVSGQSSLPYFPENACYPAMRERFSFHLLDEDSEISIGNVKIRCHKMTHPGGSCAFRFTENGRSVVYCTDAELQGSDFDETAANSAFFSDTDVIIIDSQYTSTEAVSKEYWGHSAYSTAIDFAERWKVRNLYMFHYDPTYDDRKLDSMLRAGIVYQKYNSDSSTKIYLAKEGQEIQV